MTPPEGDDDPSSGGDEPVETDPVEGEDDTEPDE